MPRVEKAITLAVAAALLACAAAAEEYVVVGKRTYMSTYPFYGC